MAKLIDLDALGIGKCNPDVFNDKGYAKGWNSAIEILQNAPTVDAVAVCRCKDCKHYLNSNEKCELIDTRLHFYETDKRWTEDSFCAWGERKGVDE